MTIPTYPEYFPCPLISGYNVTVDMGILRFDSNNGGTRQRRRYTIMPHRINMQFVVKIVELNAWQTWVNNNAYSWILFPAINYQTVNPKRPHESPILLRFISDLSYGAIDGEWVQINVVAEFPSQAAQFALLGTP